MPVCKHPVAALAFCSCAVLFFDFVGRDLGASGIFVREGKNHALVEELLERFVGRDEAEIEQHVDAFGVRDFGSPIKIR